MSKSPAFKTLLNALWKTVNLHWRPHAALVGVWVVLGTLELSISKYSRSLCKYMKFTLRGDLCSIVSSWGGFCS